HQAGIPILRPTTSSAPRPRRLYLRGRLSTHDGGIGFKLQGVIRLNGTRFGTVSKELHADINGWWRIIETSQWVNDGLDDLGPAMISITGRGGPASDALLARHAQRAANQNRGIIHLGRRLGIRSGKREWQRQARQRRQASWSHQDQGW